MRSSEVDVSGLRRGGGPTATGGPNGKRQIGLNPDQKRRPAASCSSSSIATKFPDWTGPDE